MATKDPMEKIADLIQAKIDEAFSSRDRKATEDKDPWARIEGMISRAVDGAVGRHFEEFAKGIEGADGDDKGKGGRDDEDRPKLGILGL